MKYALFLCRGLAEPVFPSDMTKIQDFSLSGLESSFFPETYGIARYSHTNSTDLSGILAAALGVKEKSVTDPVFITAYVGGVIEKGNVCIECSFAGITPADDGETELVCRCDDISNQEAKELFSFLSDELSNSVFKFVGTAFGCGYVVWKQGDTRGTGIVPITDTPEAVSDVMPHGEFAQPFIDMVNRSRELLCDSSFNHERRQQGREEISALWFDSAVAVPDIPKFKDIFGISAAVCSNDAATLGLCKMADIETVIQPSDSDADLMIFDIDLFRIADDAGRAFSKVCRLVSELSAEKIMIAALPPNINDDETELCPPMPFVIFGRKKEMSVGRNMHFPADAYKSGLFVPDANKLFELLIT